MSHKYINISQEIEEKILHGEYHAGGKLPTEEELTNHYGVSRNTIRKAVDNLTRKGYIMPVQGSGMFIRDVSIENAINLENFRGLSIDYPNSVIKTKILEFEEINASEAIAIIMKCDINTPLYYISRLRTIDDQQWVIEYSYYNRDYVPYLDEDIINTSIYSYIRNDLHKQIGYVDRIIEATPLSPRDAMLLGLNEGEPALVSTNKAMFRSGEIFDYSIDIHHYKHTRFLKLSNLLF
ncbi:MAG: GntR family transcriptional regulator [Erysipelothrix sp.]|nr:GntR family transcriptional regulator [Erysipelothrix sp.]